MAVLPASSPRALAATIKEGDGDTLDMLLEILLAQKVSTLHLAELGDTAFDQDDVELTTN